MTDLQAKPAAKLSLRRGLDRRALLTALGSAVATIAQPLSARAQTRQPMRRIGVLTWWSEFDPEAQSQAIALAQGLAKLGWVEGVNIKIEYRRVFGESERIARRQVVGAAAGDLAGRETGRIYVQPQNRARRRCLLSAFI
jgi:hypothetical protein